MTDSKKPREFWIAHKEDNFIVKFSYSCEKYYDSTESPKGYEKIHVVEISALHAAQAENKKLREALEKIESGNGLMRDASNVEKIAFEALKEIK